MEIKARKLSRRQKVVISIIFGGILLLAAACLIFSSLGNFSFNPPIQHKDAYSVDTSSFPSRLTVSGNKLVLNDGRAIILKGLMPPDPARLNPDGRFKRALFEKMKETGANVIRIPVHPENWERDPDYMWRYLDPLVTWSGELGMYVIIDLHFIGNVESGAGDQMPDINTPSKEFTLNFWRTVARYFKDAPNVIFEIFNEPQSIAPAVWRKAATEIIAAIRETGADQLVIVGGVEFSRDLSWVLVEPVKGDNIAYASHIYPAHSSSSWDTWFGSVSKKYPVLMTEWGWIDNAPDGKSEFLVGSASIYGETFIKYLDDHMIGWVACWYDDKWLPPMFNKGSEEMTSFGKFVTGQLQVDK